MTPLQALRDGTKQSKQPKLCSSPQWPSTAGCSSASRLQETCFNQETAKIADQKLFSLYLRYAKDRNWL
jgi:hypothetical protein